MSGIAPGARKARSSWLNLKRSIDAEINAEEFKKPIQKMQDDVRAAVKDVDEKLKDEKFKKPIQKMQDDIRSAVKDVDEKLKDVSKAPTAKKPDHDTN